jgi:hypothetical protein
MSIEDLSPDELIEQVIEAIEDDGQIRSDMLSIEFIDNRLIISGRVASDEEIDIINEIISEDLEIDNFVNRVWVDDTLAFEGSSQSMDDEVLFSVDDDDDIDDESFEGDDDDDDI